MFAVVELNKKTNVVKQLPLFYGSLGSAQKGIREKAEEYTLALFDTYTDEGERFEDKMGPVVELDLSKKIYTASSKDVSIVYKRNRTVIDLEVRDTHSRYPGKSWIIVIPPKAFTEHISVVTH